MDQSIKTQDLAVLSLHLRGCSECQAYANEIKEVTQILAPLMRKQWRAQPAPLSIAELMARSLQTKTSNWLTIRTAVLSLVFLAMFFSAWQFIISGTPVLSPAPLSIPVVPTPSVLTAQSTSTQLTLEGCAWVSYRVQEGDSLPAIAEQFGISKESLVEVNHLKTPAIYPAMELMIPICDLTPTGTFHPATFTTTTDTPVLNHTPSIPGG
jgi:LysM repeat protein